LPTKYSYNQIFSAARRLVGQQQQDDYAQPCSAGWSWRLELELCERKTLLPGWWLEAGAGVVCEILF